MKKLIPFCLLLINLSNIASAQTPLAIPYQAVARTASGNLISNQLISVRFTIHDGSASGNVLYKEKHSPMTNAFGLFNVNIGTGTIISGTLASINWGINLKFLQVELDTTGGNNFIDMGTTQMMSVPYALHAKTVDLDKGGKTFLILTGDITDSQADSIIENNVGPNTQSVKVFRTTNLTTLDLSGCIELVKLEISENLALSNITMTNISTIHELAIIDQNENLISISFPSLSLLNCELTVFHNANLSSISFGSLKVLHSPLTIWDNNILTSINLGSVQSTNQGGSILIDNGSFTYPCSINLSNLTTINGSFELRTVNVQTLDLNNLTSINAEFKISDLLPLTSLNLNSLQTMSPAGFINIIETELSSLNLNTLNTIEQSFLKVNNNINLISINLPGLTSILGLARFSFENNAITSSGINNLLAKFASVPISGTIVLNTSGQSPPAPPTGQGIIDKNTLISNGNTVITD